MLTFKDRIRVKNSNHRLAGWEGRIKIINACRYGIEFEKTPTVTVFLNHDTVEKVEE